MTNNPSPPSVLAPNAWKIAKAREIVAGIPGLRPADWDCDPLIQSALAGIEAGLEHAQKDQG